MRLYSRLPLGTQLALCANLTIHPTLGHSNATVAAGMFIPRSVAAGR